MQQSNNDLLKRTLDFAIKIIQLSRLIPNTPTNKPLISQIIRSSSSIGANYREAKEAFSRSDFIHKISLCKKEANETIYWLELIKSNNPQITIIEELSNEASQFIRIFAASMKTAKSNKTK